MDGRVRGAPLPSRRRRFAVPVPRHFKMWTETPRTGSDRLAGLESRVRASGAIVSRGGDYDRWDLQTGRGSFATARIRMGLEEHGAGRQLVRLYVAPSFSRPALALVAVLTALSLLAWTNHGHGAAALLAVAAVALGARAVHCAGLAMGAVLHHVDGAAERNLALRRDLHELNAKRV
jgi:hypothetical protein